MVLFLFLILLYEDCQQSENQYNQGTSSAFHHLRFPSNRPLAQLLHKDTYGYEPHPRDRYPAIHEL